MVQPWIIPAYSLMGGLQIELLEFSNCQVLQNLHKETEIDTRLSYAHGRSG